MEDYLGNRIEGKISTFEPGKAFWVYAHAKRDGYCIQMRKENGEVRVNTRKPKYHVVDQPWYKYFETLPDNTCMIGELFVPGGFATDVASVLAGTKEGKFEAFCIPMFDGKDLTKESLPNIKTFALDNSIPFIKMTHGLPEKPLGEDYEGFVLKTNHLPKFPNDWMKMKAVRTMDMRIKSFTPGKGKFRGQIGSIICGTDDGKYVAKAGGMNNEWRKHFTKHEKWWIGKIISVEYQFVLKNGRLRHPRFERYRDDKSNTD